MQQNPLNSNKLYCLTLYSWSSLARFRFRLRRKNFVVSLRGIFKAALRPRGLWSGHRFKSRLITGCSGTVRVHSGLPSTDISHRKTLFPQEQKTLLVLHFSLFAGIFILDGPEAKKYLLLTRTVKLRFPPKKKGK